MGRFSSGPGVGDDSAEVLLRPRNSETVLELVLTDGSETLSHVCSEGSEIRQNDSFRQTGSVRMMMMMMSIIIFVVSLVLDFVPNGSADLHHIHRNSLRIFIIEKHSHFGADPNQSKPIRTDPNSHLTVRNEPSQITRTRTVNPACTSG